MGLSLHYLIFTAFLVTFARPQYGMKNMACNVVHVLKLCLFQFCHKFVLIKTRMTLMTKLNRTVPQERKHSKFLACCSVVAQLTPRLLGNCFQAFRDQVVVIAFKNKNFPLLSCWFQTFSDNLTLSSTTVRPHREHFTQWDVVLSQKNEYLTLRTALSLSEISQHFSKSS